MSQLTCATSIAHFLNVTVPSLSPNAQLRHNPLWCAMEVYNPYTDTTTIIWSFFFFSESLQLCRYRFGTVPYQGTDGPSGTIPLRHDVITATAVTTESAMFAQFHIRCGTNYVVQITIDHLESF